MSIALLLEKYDVSTEEGLQKALNEIEKEESEVNDALSNALSKACVLEGRLRTASQAYSKLSEVRNEAQIATDMVDKTAALARDVSAKVRQLDLARSRVAECQQRVHDLIDLKVCSAGVEAAIKAHDYETAAGHVSRFLSMEPASVAAARARGDTDPRHDITTAANTLREHLIQKFEEASKKADDASIERLFKLFPQIGCAEQGVDMLSKYVASQLDTQIRRASVVSGGEAGAHADALTRVLEAGARAVERVRALSAAAPRALPCALALLQPPICSGVRAVCRSLTAGRAEGAEGRSPLAVEPALHELALAHHRLQLYFAFLRRRVELNTSMEEAAKTACAQAVEQLIAASDSTRTAQDVLGHYLTLERYYLEESVSKALKLSAPQPGAASSLVDDVFFIARKVIRRGVSTGSIEGVCCVVNETGAQLERAAAALRKRLAAPPPDPLPFPPPRPLAPHPHPALTRVSKELETLYFAHLSEAELGGEWAERLAADACELAEALCRGAGERDKLRSCAGGLAGAAAAFRSAAQLGRAALRAALHHALALWAQQLVDPNSDIEDAEEEANALPAALDVLAEEARAQLPAAADELLAELLDELVSRAQRNMLANHYSREGGACVERRCRRLSTWAGSNAGAAREACARLAQLAALLAAERPEPPPGALGALLPPALVRQALAARTDFKLEDIKRLKL